MLLTRDALKTDTEEADRKEEKIFATITVCSSEGKEKKSISQEIAEL